MDNLSEQQQYALESNGVNPLKADWVKGDGLRISVDVKDVSGYYQWFDPPKPYVAANNK